jgi:MFS family permease
MCVDLIPHAGDARPLMSAMERTAAPTSDDDAKPGAEDSYPPLPYAWYVVGVLTLAYILSFIDRQILSLLVGPIKRDLGISDTSMSLLMGFSFAVFYTLFGIPLGRMADSRSRRLIIAVGIAAWSVMTAGCGLAQRYWQLALMRMGVGVGEASLSPAAYSLIADYFRPEHRATAISVYSMGIYVGSGLAFILGGLVVKFVSGQDQFELPIVGATRAWQLIFFVVGLPGLPMALLLLTVREPTRKGARLAVAGAAVPLREVLEYFRENRATFLGLNLGMACLTFSAYAASTWIPTFLVRVHGWSAGQTGVVFGLIVAIAGTLGIMTGGWLADWLRQRGHADAEVRVALFSAIGWLPFGILYPLVPHGSWAAILLAPAIFFTSAPFGVAPAAIQRMMPNAMRAQATALYLFVINLIGMGLGPTAVALMTDGVFKDENAVNLSLLVVCLAADTAAIALLWAALNPYRQSLEYLGRWNRGSPAGDSSK